MKAIPLQVPEGYFPPSLKKAEAITAFPKNVTAAQLKSRHFPEAQRQLLADVLLQQYAHVSDFTNSAVYRNIQLLREQNTFTVTSGQQLHLMMGPLYVLFKITDTIRMARKLQLEFPEYHFVPVFWMASEDHDFEEISTLKVFGRSFAWETPHGGPVGRLSVNQALPLLDEVSGILHRPEEQEIWRSWSACYKPGMNLSQASRNFIHQLFASWGLVCLDPDDAAFKSCFKELMEQELLNGVYAAAFLEQNLALEKAGVKPEALVRNPNLFHMASESGKRSRIERVAGQSEFVINDVLWPKRVILEELEDDPSCFSPNVLMRPLYQETILPNLAYIAGPSEYLYWQQTVSAFGKAGLAIPALIRRSGFVIPDEKSAKLLQETRFDINNLWLDEKALRRSLSEYIDPQADFAQLSVSWKDLGNRTADLLSGYKSPYLRELRNVSDEVNRILLKAIKHLQNQLLTQPEVLPETRHLLKIAERYFSTMHPQERTASAVSSLLTTRGLIDFLCSSFIGEDGLMYVLLETH